MSGYIAFITEDEAPVAIAASLGGKNRWVRWLKKPFYSRSEKGYPTTVIFQTRKQAAAHARYVIREMNKYLILRGVPGYVIYEVHRRRK
jgi:hypothetical protein